MGNSIGRGKLGLKKIGHGDENTLRFCLACAREQHVQYGHTWWQLHHQLPTSLVCIEHQLPLEALPVERYRGIARNFYLPSLELKPARDDDKPREVMHRLIEVAKWGANIHGQDRFRLTDDTLRWCYLLQARELGWVAFDGSLRMQLLRDAFVSHYGVTLEHFDTYILGDLAGVNGGFLAYLFRQLPSRRHPLKHALLLNFLFENFEEFEKVFCKIRQTLDSDGSAGCEKLLHDSQVALLRLVKDGGQSLSKAAPAVGTSVTTAARFIDRHKDIQRDRRPHIIGTEKEVMLRQLLQKGVPRKEIAEKVGVRRTFIKDYLAQRQALKFGWETAHRANEREKHRAQLLSALKTHPFLPIKAIRLLPQNGFQWLYNNDREWLKEKLPAIWKR